MPILPINAFLGNDRTITPLPAHVVYAAWRPKAGWEILDRCASTMLPHWRFIAEDARVKRRDAGINHLSVNKFSASPVPLEDPADSVQERELRLSI